MGYQRRNTETTARSVPQLLLHSTNLKFRSVEPTNFFWFKLTNYFLYSVGQSYMEAPVIHPVSLPIIFFQLELFI